MSSDQTVTGTFNRVLPLPPKITGLSESNSVFRAGPSSTSLTGHTAARGHRRGTVFSFRLDRAATVKLAITRRAKGRRVGHRCVPATRRLRSKRACTRNITVATLTRSAQAGLNRLPFSGRLRSRALAPTRYEAVFTAADSAGVSAARALAFKVVRR